MNAPFFISWRYQRGKHKNRLVSLISMFSTLGISLGVMVLIIGLSAMNGFERELNKRILAVVPHSEILATPQLEEEKIINQWQNLTALLKQDSEIIATSPFVSFTALVEYGTTLKVVQVRGIEPTKQEKVSTLWQFVLGDGWKKFVQEGGLILGSSLAHTLNVKEGDWITLLISKSNGGTNFTQPIRQRIKIAGILRLDGQLDHRYALIPLNMAQQFLDYRADQVTGIELKVSNPFMVQQMQYPTLQSYPQHLSVHTWISKFGYMYRDIQLVRTVMYLAMVLVIGVACFNIISTLIMAVKDKQGDIAIMRTLGANDRFIKKIFIYYGLQAGMKGCLIGIILGSIIALNLTGIIEKIEYLIGRKLLSDGVYFIDFLPSELHLLDIAIVFAVALLLSLIASLYPSTRAVKLHPAQVLSNY